MIEEPTIKYVTLYCHWRNFTLEDFAKKVHIYFTDPSGREKSMSEVVSNLFEENKQLIFDQMTPDDKRRWAFYKVNGKYPTTEDMKDNDEFEKKIEGNYPLSFSDLTDDKMILPYPCRLRINANCVTKELMISETNFQVDEDNFFAFEDEHIAEVLDTPDVTAGTYNKTAPKVTVIIHSNSRELMDLKNPLDIVERNAWRNISDLVINLNTSVTGNVGSFSITLPWVEPNEEAFELVSSLYVNRDVKVNKGYVRQRYNVAGDSTSYYNMLFNVNDIVFISFNDILSMNTFDTVATNDSGKVVGGEYDLERVASENVFDMIGLIDNITFNKTASGAMATVQITGRDLSKLLIDDGSFFFNPSTTANPSEIFANDLGYGIQGDIVEVDGLSGKNQSIKRVRGVLGEIDIFRNFMNQTIDFIVKGVISRLANIEVVPSSVFKKWENRTKWTDINVDAIGNDADKEREKVSVESSNESESPYGDENKEEDDTLTIESRTD